MKKYIKKQIACYSYLLVVSILELFGTRYCKLRVTDGNRTRVSCLEGMRLTVRRQQHNQSRTISIYCIRSCLFIQHIVVIHASSILFHNNKRSPHDLCRLYWQGQKDSNPQQRFWRPTCITPMISPIPKSKEGTFNRISAKN